MAKHEFANEDCEQGSHRKESALAGINNKADTKKRDSDRLLSLR